MEFPHPGHWRGAGGFQFPEGEVPPALLLALPARHVQSHAGVLGGSPWLGKRAGCPIPTEGVISTNPSPLQGGQTR